MSGWEAIHREGARLAWDEAFERAIELAHGGLAVTRGLSRTLVRGAGRLSRDPGIAAVFYPGGEPATAGSTVLQPKLGATLQLVAELGPKALYGGEVGDRYVRGLRAAGSTIALEDLTRHRADLLPPVIGRYRDLDVRVAAPNSQGFVLLEMLAMCERLDLRPDPLGPDAGQLALAFAAAGRDRDRHLADHDAMRIQPSTLLDDGHIAALCDEVRDESDPAGARVRPSGDTIALMAADAEGRAISLIQSLFHGFGAGILEPESGIVAQNRGACFVLQPGHPNAMAPAKRPAHTLLPVLAHREGELAAIAGTMGGYAQPQIDLMSLVRRFDLGLDPAAAVAAPRWVIEPDGLATVEKDVGPEASLALERAGFPVAHVGQGDSAVGHAQLIVVHGGRFIAGSDPRADGGALAM